MNLCPCGWINYRSQDLSYALVSLIQRVMSITTYVVVKVVSCMVDILLRKEIIWFLWGNLNFVTSPNMKTVGLMLWLTRALWSTGKEVITDIGFRALKDYWKWERGKFMEAHRLKRGAIGPGGFMEMPLTINSCQKILVMWDVLVLNGTKKSLIYILKGAWLQYYGDVNLFGFDCAVGPKVR